MREATPYSVAKDDKLIRLNQLMQRKTTSGWFLLHAEKRTENKQVLFASSAPKHAEDNIALSWLLFANLQTEQNIKLVVRLELDVWSYAI